tara:strand:- start:58782 stop:59123 length:342 start_codon:yes stop_codon:yes gene_type:complete
LRPSISVQQFPLFKEKARDVATAWARRDIGGDTQPVHRLEMQLSDETFKHILLPVYISSYKFNSKRYNFYVNGQTGKIHGTRPYSFWKIFLAILAGLMVIAAIVYFVNLNQKV